SAPDQASADKPVPATLLRASVRALERPRICTVSDAASDLYEKVGRNFLLLGSPESLPCCFLSQCNQAHENRLEYQSQLLERLFYEQPLFDQRSRPALVEYASRCDLRLTNDAIIAEFKA